MRTVNVEQMAINIRKNDVGQWGKGRTSNEPGTEPGHASFRFGQDPLVLKVQPQEMLPENPKVFTMGSCFAREIEFGLARRGIGVLSMPPEILSDPDFQGAEGYVRRDIINRYNTPSMELEFRNLLEPEPVLSDTDLIVELRPGALYDAHYVGDYPNATVEELLHRRNKLRTAFRAVADAEVIVITLGLAEACFDLDSGKYRNMSPTVRELRQRKRLEIHMVDFKANMQSLENIYRLVRTYCRRDPLIVCTVSPVPLTMTYFDEDVIVANSAAKSILRAAAYEFSSSFDRVDYFPSYEFATLSTRRRVYTGDQRHIRKPFVDYIIRNFMTAYGLGEGENGAEGESEATERAEAAPSEAGAV